MGIIFCCKIVIIFLKLFEAGLPKFVDEFLFGCYCVFHYKSNMALSRPSSLSYGSGTNSVDSRHQSENNMESHICNSSGVIRENWGREVLAVFSDQQLALAGGYRNQWETLDCRAITRKPWHLHPLPPIPGALNLGWPQARKLHHSLACCHPWGRGHDVEMLFRKTGVGRGPQPQGETHGARIITSRSLSPRLRSPQSS